MNGTSPILFPCGGGGGAQETTSLMNITCLLLKLRILINRLGYSECQGHFRENSSMGAESAQRVRDRQPAALWPCRSQQGEMAMPIVSEH